VCIGALPAEITGVVIAAGPAMTKPSRRPRIADPILSDDLS
jgi:hypothetical protein